MPKNNSKCLSELRFFHFENAWFFISDH